MRIVICGSSAFRKQMVEYRDKLKKMGLEAVVHPHYVEEAKGGMQDVIKRMEKEHAAVKKEYGYIKWYHDAIVRSDAILVLNFDKNGTKNYIGGNTLMEIGFAHVNDKKIFLLNPVPEIGYKDEILAMITAILNGDLSKIN